MRTDFEKTEIKEILTCADCGTKWELNNEKHSYSCPFCGSSLLGNTSKEEVPIPDYIIPFKLSREEAAGKIREAFKIQHFLPGKVRDFSIDELHGLFLPYCLYDLDYSDEEIWIRKKHTFAYEQTERYPSFSQAYFLHVSVVACKSFSMEYAKHIEPYTMEELVPYAPSLVSGHLNPLPDIPAGKTEDLALNRVQQIVKKYNEDIIAKTQSPGIGYHYFLDQTHNECTYKIPYKEYALLPIWYFRVVHKGQIFIAIVNGQTGKVEIDLPPNRTKYAACVGMLFLMVSLAFVLLFLQGVQSLTPEEVYSVGIQYYKDELFGPYPKTILYAIITCAIIWFGVLIMFIVKRIKRKKKNAR